MKKLGVSIIVSWIVFIGIDFFFHAGVLKTLWEMDTPALKPLETLALLIPSGYFSFLLLTILIGYVFNRFFPKKPTVKEVLIFALVFSSLFSLSNFFGLYSYVSIPIKHLITFNLVYFIEIFTVSFFLYKLQFSANRKRVIFISFLSFLLLIILGIIIQNCYIDLNSPS